MDRTMYDDAASDAQVPVACVGDLEAYAGGAAYGEGWWDATDPAQAPHASDPGYSYDPGKIADDGWGR